MHGVTTQYKTAHYRAPFCIVQSPNDATASYHPAPTSRFGRVRESVLGGYEILNNQ